MAKIIKFRDHTYTYAKNSNAPALSKYEELRFSFQFRRFRVVEHLHDVLVADCVAVGAEDAPVLAVGHDCHDAHFVLVFKLSWKLLQDFFHLKKWKLLLLLWLFITTKLLYLYWSNAPSRNFRLFFPFLRIRKIIW